jgi:hypothetical protein
MNTVIANPQMGADMVLQALMDGTDPKPQLANKFVSGGRLNSRNTLDELMAVGCNGSICFGPSGIQADNVADNDADIVFNVQADADATNLYWREVGSNNWTPELDITSPVALTGLNSCSEYEFYLESNCGGDISNPTSIQTFATLGCGACIDNQYCTNAASDGVDEWIESFTIDTYTNQSGNDGGYGDFTGNPIQLDVDNTYDIDIEVAWGGTLYNEQSRIWIDLDQDGEFGADELLFDQGTADQTVNVIGQVTIPAGTPLGTTRMRVQMAYVGGQTELPEVCDSYQWGEVEDYCVDILSGITCGLDVDGSAVNPTCNGNDNGEISVTVGGGSGNYTYDWSSNLGNTASVSNVGNGSYSVVITDVDAGCDTTINFSLDYDISLSVQVEAENISCNGLTDGAAQAIASGSSNYSYQWTGGPNADVWDGLGVGTYEITVTDGNGCATTSAVNIQEPAADQASFTSNVNFLNVQFNNTSTSGTNAWDFGDGNTSSATSPQHNYGLPGTYNVCLTVTTACGETETCNTVTVDEDDSSIDENYANYVSVYPNPTNSFVNFYITHPNVKSLVVMDIVGKEVMTSNIVGELTQINIEGFSNGTYFYRLLGVDGSTLVADKLFKVK